MKKNHPEICLFRPEIPQNTGTIGRMVAATHSRLHLILPLGFGTDDKNLRRAGLDYWPFLDLEIHDSIEDLFKRFDPSEIAFFSTKGTKSFKELDDRVRLLIFGQETKGLPHKFFEQFPENFYTIPMLNSNVRSMNLANAVSIVMYQHLDQHKLI